MSSQSASSSNAYDIVKDGRVAVDGEGIGISSEGDVMVHMVADEAFMLGEAALETVRDANDGIYRVTDDFIRGSRDLTEHTIGEVTGLAELIVSDSRDSLKDVTQEFSDALAVTQQNSKTESGQIAEQMVKIGLPVVVLAFAVSQIWGK